MAILEPALIPRPAHLAALRRKLRHNPVVALLGARQVGKTTLAMQLADDIDPATRFDLEDPRDLARLDEPMLALEPLRGLVVVDEVQRRPDLFPVLRVLADRRPLPARFLVLGNASPMLLRQSSESLAGRIALHELPGLDLAETGSGGWQELWLRGGFPRAWLAPDDAHSAEWRRDFVRMFVERDLPGWEFPCNRDCCATSGPCWLTTTAKPGTPPNSGAPSGWPTPPFGATWTP